MINYKLCLMALATTWWCSVSAGHLKVHVETSHRLDHDDHHLDHDKHHDRHAKKIPSPYENRYPDAVHYGQFLRNNYKDIYAVCVFEHEGYWFTSADYSIGFFDQQGVLMKKFCNEIAGTEFSEVTNLAGDPDDWSEVVIDDVSKCYLYKDEEQGAEELMVSYSCRE